MIEDTSRSQAPAWECNELAALPPHQRWRDQDIDFLRLKTPYFFDRNSGRLAPGICLSAVCRRHIRIMGVSAETTRNPNLRICMHGKTISIGLLQDGILRDQIRNFKAFTAKKILDDLKKDGFESILHELTFLNHNTKRNSNSNSGRKEIIHKKYRTKM